MDKNEYKPQRYSGGFILTCESMKFDPYYTPRLNRERYKGKGRPRKGDYDIKTLSEWLYCDLTRSVDGNG